MFAALTIVGCGNEYRPVVSAINPVGPAGQPAKYAVAVSSPSSTSPGLVTYVDFAGDTVLSTPNVLANPSYFAITQTASQGFVINSSGSLDNFGLGNPTAVLTSTIGQTTLAANSDPVTISAVTPYGSTQTLFIPEAASSKIAILNASGAPSLLQELAVDPNPVYVVGADGAPRVYALSEGSTPGGNGTVASIEALSSSALAVSATIPVGVAPVYGVMTTDDRRAFVLNQGSGTVSVVNVINNALDSTTPTITLPALNGVTPDPVWADLSTVSDQLVVLSASGGVNASGQNYQGTYSASSTYAPNAVVSYSGGLYFEKNPSSVSGVPPTNTVSWSLLTPGTLSIINIPLCSAATQPSNPNCNLANPVDATNFGTFLTQVPIPVGIAPTMVSVLHDGSAAYVISQFDSTGKCAAGQGSVSIVSLTSGQVTNTICAVASGPTTDGYIHGHPNSVSATTGDPTGKVYVTSSDSTDLSVIYTDTNTVQTHITLQGLGVRVLVTSP